MKQKLIPGNRKFSTLYKMSSQGKIEQWSIKVVQTVGSRKSHQVVSTYGEYLGKMQTKSVIVSKGKNIGKKNETDVYSQACLVAESKQNAMLKKGYVKSLKDARAGKLDKVIKGGIIPMSAHKWQNYAHRIIYPVFVQPKLDGERCTAEVSVKGKVTLWTRSRKPITACPHIIRQLETFFKAPLPEKIILDGELYKHGLTVKQLEKLKGSFRKKTHSDLSLTGEFHIYDRAQAIPFKRRLDSLMLLPDFLPHVHFVTTDLAHSERQVNTFYRSFLRQKYEGLMARDPEAEYQHKRTAALLKYKPRDDDEFKIIDVIKGEDNTVVFRCKTKEGKIFKATKAGDKSENQKYLKNKKAYIGKMLTVQYQGYSGKNNVPLFPTAIRIRKDL